MNGLLEYKEFFGSVEDVDTKNRIVTGYLTSFDDEKDKDGDIKRFGMFAKTLAEKGPKGKNSIYFLNQHKWDQPHGKFAVLEERDAGLYFESKPLPNTSYSNDAIVLYQEGIVKEHSFGFVTIKSEQDYQRQARIIKEVSLFEGSNVTMGSDSNTPFAGFKSLSITQINEKTASIIKMLRNGNLTDETFQILEIALKQLQTEAFEYGKKEALESKTNEPSVPDTQKDYEPLIDTLKQFTNSLKTK